jgi:putative Mn2+ efflux pump MntP
MKMAGVYAFFQFAMPMIGWFCVKQIATAFRAFQPFIPWIALGLLLYIGGNMILEGLKKKFDEKKGIEDKEDETKDCISDKTLIIQGIATSIDALSVGFTIVKYGPLTAFLASLIIAIVTFTICVGGVKLGKMFGARLEKHANYLGGSILIAIGLEIFIGSFL